MADLDDFFAKKDRKKKTVKKFTTTDELSKQLDDTKLKTESKPKKEKTGEGEDGARGGHEEEEWREYEEEVKDYTGLKIQVLTSSNNESESATSGDESSDTNQSKGRGPWNKNESGAEEQAKAAQPVPAAPEPAAGKYVPAPLRKQQLNAEQTRRTQNKNAPDIHNDDYFPVLGASGRRAPNTGGAWSSTGPGSGANRAAATAQPQKISLGNRFNTLSDS